MPFRVQPRTVVVLWVAYWCFLFVSTHVPIPEGAPRVRHADKAAHFVAYFGLTMLGAWRLAAQRKLTTRALWRWAVVYGVYGVIEETLQPLVGRTASLWDWLADAVGVALAALAVLRFWREKLSEPAAQDDGDVGNVTGP